MRKFTLYSVGAIGFFLLFGGGLFVVSSYFQISADKLLYKLESSGDLSETEMDSLILQKEIAEKWSLSGDAMQDLGLAQFYRGMQHQVLSKEQEDLFVSAKNNIIKGLSKSPASPYSWFRLAYIYMVLDQDFDKAAEAVYMSALTGPNERELLFHRLKLASVVWNYFDDEQQGYMKTQILAAWNIRPKRVIDLLDTDQSKRLLIQAIDSCQECIKKYNELVAY